MYLCECPKMDKRTGMCDPNCRKTQEVAICSQCMYNDKKFITRKKLNEYVDKLIINDQPSLAPYGTIMPLWKSVIYDLIHFPVYVLRLFFIIK